LPINGQTKGAATKPPFSTCADTPSHCWPQCHRVAHLRFGFAGTLSRNCRARCAAPRQHVEQYRASRLRHRSPYGKPHLVLTSGALVNANVCVTLSERILNVELDEHLDGERLEGSANRRNGCCAKTRAACDWAAFLSASTMRARCASRWSAQASAA
jgi:hypothetical protein